MSDPVRRWTCGPGIRTAWVPFGIVLVMVAAPMHGQDREVSLAPRGLVVAVKERAAAGPHGAGTLIALAGGVAYVLTARHVAFEGDQALDLDAQFGAHLPGWHPVTSVAWSHRDLDVALLAVAVPPHGLEAVDFSRLGRTTELRFGDVVYPVGCPGGRCYERPVTPDRLLSLGGGRMRVQTRVVEPGNSGGPVFNAEWEVVGVTWGEIQVSEAEAIAIDTILALVPRAYWRAARERLHRRGIPRRGYPTRATYTVLFPAVSPQDVAQGERWPGGRLVLAHSLHRGLSGHVSYLRLAPTDLDVKSGMVGLTFDPLPSAAASLEFYGEVGVGVVQARIPGTPFLTESDSSRTFSRVDEIAVGAGVALVPRVTVAPGFSVHFLVAHYRFGRPDGAVALPRLVFGAGVGWGFRW